MRIGYIASHLYRHTFEINEVSELIARRPDTRVYSFYRSVGPEVQSQRLRERPIDVVSWSPASVIQGFFAVALRYPLRTLRAGIELAFRSLPNPVYWFKNAAAFFISMPFLADARRRGVTHLHANFGSSPATVAWLGNRILGTSMSVTFHAFDIYFGALSHKDPLKRQKLRDADHVFAVHRHGLDHLAALVPELPRDKFHVIRISVAFEPVAEEDPRRRRSSMAAGPPLLLAAGNLVAKKGFDVLVRAAANLAREGFDTRVRILGEGPERRRLESLASAEGVADRVELPGFYQHKELAIHLAEAAAFVMPSRIAPGGQRDGIPTVVPEAWLARAPVVASLVGGMSEVIVDGETGLVFPPGDARALANCIRNLLGCEELRAALTEGGLRRAREEFSPEKNAAELLKKIESAGPKLTPQVGQRQTGAD